MRVYVAGPISNGENKEMGYQVVVDNIRNAIELGGRIADKGYAPMVPHLTHFWNLMAPRSYKEWIRIDDEWVVASDVVYRMPGASKGADHEVELALSRGIPVVRTMEELDAVYNRSLTGTLSPATGGACSVDRDKGGPELLPNRLSILAGEGGGLRKS